MVTLLLLLLSMQGESPSIDRLLVDLVETSIEVRSRATRSLIDQWKTWTEVDLEKLRKCELNPDPEVVTRTREALKWIEWFRGIPSEIWKDMPDLETSLRSGDGNRLGELLKPMQRGESRIPIRAAMPLVIGLLEDTRNSGIQPEWWYGSGEPPLLTLDDLVAEILCKWIPRFRQKPTKKEAYAWWKVIREKPERDWYLGDLLHTDAWVRGTAIRKLAELKDEAAIPRICEVLPSLRESSVFAHAVMGFSNFSTKVRCEVLKPHLGDPRFEVRWAVAQLLKDALPREAVDTMIEALENPQLLREHLPGPWRTRDVFQWFAEAHDESAMDFVLRHVRSGKPELRVFAIRSVREIPHTKVDEVLVGAINDPAAGSFDLGWGGAECRVESMTNARVCDVAAIVLSERLGVLKDFRWLESVRARNRNIEKIVNGWRNARDLPPIEYLGPGVAAVPSAEVSALLPALISSDRDLQVAAVSKLSRLGPGAWRSLLGEIDRSPLASHRLLEESALKAANSIRSITVHTQAAEVLAKRLRLKLYCPIDVEDIVSLIGCAWIDIPDSGKLTCLVIRGADGAGFDLQLYLDPPVVGGRATQGLSFSSSSSGQAWIRFDREVYLSQLRRILEPIDSILGQSDTQAQVRFTIQRDRITR